jgi:hypothetical protein
MANVIKIKRSTSTATPTSLAEGELAYSENSNNLFIGTSGSNVTVIGGSEGIADAVGAMVSGNTETGISVTYQDSDNTLDFALTADPTITLGGDLSGAATLTNLANATLTATIASNAVQKAMVHTDVITGQTALTANPDGDNDYVLIYDNSATSYKKIAAKYLGSNSLSELDNVGSDTATAANFLVADGTDWESVAMSGDVTMTAAGATTIGAGKVLATELGVTAGTATASKALVVDANKDINLGSGDVTATNLTGSIQTASQGNITTLGTLTGLTVGGDLTVADGTNDFDIASHDGTNGLKLGGVLVSASSAEINVLDGATAGTAVASKALVVDSSKDINLGSGDITATNVTGTLQTAAQANITSVGSLNGLTVASSQTVSMGSNKITNVADPSQAQDAATKSYVDAVKTGLDVKESVRVATTASGTLASAFDNGSTVDGITLATGNRIFLKNQSTASENGIYTVNSSGVPTRATDFDASSEVSGGVFTFVEEGTTNADSGWVCTNDGTVTIGSTSLTFAQFSGAGQLTAGTGMTKTGNTLDVVAGNGITANANNIAINTTWAGQSAITTLGTIASGAWQGDTVTAGYGGTGISSYTAGDLMYASGTTAISKLNKGTAGQVLKMNSGASAPEWTNELDGGTF